MPSTTMLVLCSKRYLETIVEEFEDWQDEGIKVALYSITPKANGGFVLISWSKPIPEIFHTKLKKDEDILDYLTYSPVSE